MIGSVCIFEKKNKCLSFKNSVLCVQRNVLGENFCIKKLFFLKTHGFWEKNFRIFVKMFPAKLTSFHPTFAEEGFSGKISRKKIFLSLFPDLEQKIDYWRNIRMYVKTLFYVSGGIFWGKTLFSKFYDIFFMYFERRIVKIGKKIPQNCKNSILHV